MSPTVTIPQQHNAFRLVKELDVEGNKVVEYLSSNSGVRVLFALVNRPLVDGVFVLPTEAHDDNGCAHALEHLIFLGSKKYPHSQVLDAMASRCLAQGTNAWTETDHTAYTLTTAGYSGFLNLVPVYLDHILHPTLNDHAFITEVHHINERGLNDGVVYSEMQDYEHQGHCVVQRTLREALYPEGSGYRQETGGRLKELRSLNNDTIKEFHKKFYRWDNLSIIVIGVVPIDDLLSTVSLYERSDVSAQMCSPQLRLKNAPWMSSCPVPKIKSPINVKFPSEDADDDLGEVLCGWRGPDWTSFQERLIIEALGEYLTHSNASPLQRQLVHVKNPYAGEVEFDEDSYKHTSYVLRFTDVPRKRASQICSVIRQALTNELIDGIDIFRLQLTLKRMAAVRRQHFEEDPEQAYGQPLIEYVVNCPTPDRDVLESLWKTEETLLNNLMSQDEEFWKSSLQKYFLIDKPAEVIGLPCQKTARTVHNEEEELQKRQINLVESSGKELVTKRIADAKFYHDARPPVDIVCSIPVADVTCVPHLEFDSYSNFSIQDPRNNHACNELSQLPFPVLVTDVPSQFYEIRIMIRIPGVESNLNKEDLALLPLLTSLLFETNIKTDRIVNLLPDSLKSESEISHEGLSQLLLEYVTDHSCIQGISGAPSYATRFPEILTAGVSCEKHRINEGLIILLATLTDSEFTASRIESIAKQMLGELIRKQRKGKNIATQLQLGLRYKRNSIRMLTSAPYQTYLLRQIIQNSDLYVSKFQHLKQVLFDLQNVRFAINVVGNKIHLFSDQKFLSELRNVLTVGTSTSFPQLSDFFNLSQSAKDTIEKNSPLPFGDSVVCASPSHDGGCVLVSVPGPQGEENDENAVVNVLCEMMSSCEGPLFSSVRGSGYAYTACLNHDIHTGQLLLNLVSCSDPIAALQTAQKVFKEFLDEKSKEHIETLLDSAKCSALYQLVRNEATMSDYALEQLNNILLKRGGSYTANMFRKQSVPWRIFNGVHDLHPLNLFHSKTKKFVLLQIKEVITDLLLQTAQKYLSAFLSLSAAKVSMEVGKAFVLVAKSNKADEIYTKLQSTDCFVNPREVQKTHCHNYYAFVITGDPDKTEVTKSMKEEDEWTGDEGDSCSED